MPDSEASSGSSAAAKIADRRVDADESIDLKSDIISVYVGADTKPYLIHDKLLSSNSSFFAAALKKSWTEGQKKEVPLPEVDTEDFERYAHYLYTGDIACKREEVSDEYNILAQSYALGEKLLDTTYKDTIIDALLVAIDQEEAPFGTMPTIDCVNIIWEATTEGSRARELLIDIYGVRAGGTFGFGDDENPAHPEFMREVAEAMASRREVKEEERWELEEKMSSASCAYHEHDENEECRARKRRKLG